MDEAVVRQGIRDICKLLGHSELIGLAKTVTNGELCVDEGGSEAVEVAIGLVVQFSLLNTRQFLERRRITKSILFNYVQQNCPNALAPNMKSADLIDSILQLWSNQVAYTQQSTPDSSQFQNQNEQENTSSSAPTVEDLLPGQVWHRLTALETEDWDAGDCFENISLTCLAAAGNAQPSVSSLSEGMVAVSLWLRSLSKASQLNKTAESVKHIAHGHGFLVEFRGNIFRGEGMIGVFRILFLMVEPPGAIGQLKIQRVHVELIFTNASHLSSVASAPQLRMLAQSPQQQQIHLSLQWTHQ